ncbi:DUF4148 domain-containing protein [Noviherbaspirillum cavernae]|uniref:DUF4148 domain-containing protein n=1 Tax=Noviherbaspirillum cavernae TaxID=2320862 RepID=A0A418WXT8_9BURK|nr:DUF4148 domain-containing protein [Noviherbaspirillum cavernae]RJG05039.1 DUF4148 domain-containing protein [Noviherbaspirillum cavernae]
MKTKQMIAAVAVLFAAGSVMAANDAKIDQSGVQATKTRAQVRAEVEQAYAQGQLAAQQNTEFVEYPNLAAAKARNEATLAAKPAAPAAAGGN